MNRRRKVVVALAAGCAAAPFASLAQPRKVHRIGVLSFQTASSINRYIDAFTQSLQQLGYIEGKTIQIERRFADGNAERLPALAKELAAFKADVIFVSSTPPTQALKQVVGPVPLVFVNVQDPIGSGFVQSLARPGGNLTGLTNVTWEISAKRLELLREVAPNVSRLAAIGAMGPKNPQLNEILKGGKTLGLEILRTQIRHRDDFEPVAAQLRKWRFDSVLILATPRNFHNRALLAEFAAVNRVPSVSPSRDFVEAGALLSYGVDDAVMYRRAAAYVDKILKGTHPRDLPVEQPTTFELVVNMKTAKALGITIPQTVLMRVDKAIE